MDQHVHLLERIEAALRETPFCSACGTPTAVVERRGGLWLSCSAMAAPSLGIGGTLKRLVPHDLRRLVDPDEIVADGRRYAPGLRSSRSRLAG